MKDMPAAELADAVRRVHQGLRAFDPKLAVESMSAGINPLTEREIEVLQVARTGVPVVEIAKKVFLSPGTVRNHLSKAMAKTGGATRAEAARIATEQGWL